jgi:hypothetical protein
MGSWFWVNAIDTRTSAEIAWFSLTNIFSTFAVKDNWNILPSVSYISVSKYLGKTSLLCSRFCKQNMKIVNLILRTGFDSRGIV